MKGEGTGRQSEFSSLISNKELEKLKEERDRYRTALTYITNIGSQYDDLTELKEASARLVRAIMTAEKALEKKDD